jgi:hypothetical protein
MVLRGVSAVFAVLATAACATHAGPTMPTPAAFPMIDPPAALRPSPGAIDITRVLPADVVDTALGYRGVPYVFGGADPATGFDCSGYVQYVLAQHAITVPRTAAEQFRVGRRIALRDVQAGDLVFFTTVAPGASHVGFALADGAFVHAPASSGVVRVERLDAAYWQSRFVGARRLLSE